MKIQKVASIITVVLLSTLSSTLAERDLTEITLPAKDAKLVGPVGLDKDRGNLTGWEGKNTSVSWDIAQLKPGTYQVSIEYSCEQENGGKFEISTGSQKSIQTAKYTGGWAKYKTKQLGTLTVKDTDTTFTMVPTKVEAGRFLMNLMSVKLKKGNY
jgi:hypothetical protein